MSEYLFEPASSASRTSIKGAQATALAVFLARTGHDKEAIRSEVARRFGYDLARTVDEIRPTYGFDVSCQGTAPEAIIAFLDATSYEDAVRNAVSLGGDSDTLACITGGIAEAYYGLLPGFIRDQVRVCLTDDLWAVVERFCSRHRRNPGGTLFRGASPRTERVL